ncbi:O-methyltransferase [Camelliibacillus cellulosilyticus]|uniref:tRNA 5-hydroxyuridine methyltransferase n=1 Tax=Camelliibacillus cellulosilyticus TaxID=2174486 RepID=A0ABV9GKQ6_9BACL
MTLLTNEQYVKLLNNHAPRQLEDIERQAKSRGIPIMQPEALAVIQTCLRLFRPRHILEIGAAIGYSALKMAGAVDGGAIVTTVERDLDLATEAVENIKTLGASHLITVIGGDAVDRARDIHARGPYDLIVIDAAKSHYKTYFQSFAGDLRRGGLVICDNVLFRGYAANPETAPKRLRTIARKMNQFNEWLRGHPDFYTDFLPVGDGLSISYHQSDQVREDF